MVPVDALGWSSSATDRSRAVERCLVAAVLPPLTATSVRRQSVSAAPARVREAVPSQAEPSTETRRRDTHQDLAADGTGSVDPPPCRCHEPRSWGGADRDQPRCAAGRRPAIDRSRTSDPVDLSRALPGHGRLGRGGDPLPAPGQRAGLPAPRARGRGDQQVSRPEPECRAAHGSRWAPALRERGERADQDSPRTCGQLAGSVGTP